MRLKQEDARVFDRYTKPKLTDWFLYALTSWASEDHEDGFHPHSFLNLYETPIEGLEQLYSTASIKTKRSLRSAIKALAAPCRPASHDFPSLDPNKRITLLKAFLRLSEYTLCFESSPQIGAIALEDMEYWEREGFAAEVFSACLRCTGNLAIRHFDSVFWNDEFAADLEESLIKMVGSTYYQAPFSPFTMYALVSVSPKYLLDHLALLGSHIAELHKADRSQKRLAYLTANRIVEKAPLELFRRFSELHFRSSRSKDRWLVEALFSAEGPLQLQRYRDDAAKPRVSLKWQPNKWLCLNHEDWIFFTPEAIGPLISPKHPNPIEEKILRKRNKLQDFFGHTSPRTYSNNVKRLRT